ncbi:MAG: VCBS repeat-containing protein [Planctomycetota bacterium]|nr:VCBS repeat-containing protein [Planctomycetota bacterium]
MTTKLSVLTTVVAMSLFSGIAQAQVMSFTDITKLPGTGGPMGNGLTGGHGAMFADIGADGQPDLHITMIWSKPMPNLFFRNLDGRKFTNEGVKRGLVGNADGGVHGFCFADLDNDGDYDAVRGLTYAIGNTRKPGRNQIKRNDGTGKFTDITDAAGIPPSRKEWTRGVITFDMDGDGDLDIFCVSGAWGSKRDRPGERNEVYRNEGKMKFTPITAGAMVTCPAGQGATDTDLDGDGDIDVIAANRTGPVNILINDGAGNFTPGPAVPVAGINDPRGIAFADIDGDGDVDFALGVKRSRNFLIRNNFNSGNWLIVKLISPKGQAGAFGAQGANLSRQKER